MEGKAVCLTLDCGKQATLQCPTCKKLDLTPAYFCGQECFKYFWPIHKLAHSKASQSTSSYKYTGPLRPGKVAPRLHVPEEIKKPDYAFTSIPTEEMNSPYQKTILVNDENSIEKMREVCLLGR